MSAFGHLRSLAAHVDQYQVPATPVIGRPTLTDRPQSEAVIHRRRIWPERIHRRSSSVMAVSDPKLPSGMPRSIAVAVCSWGKHPRRGRDSEEGLTAHRVAAGRRFGSDVPSIPDAKNIHCRYFLGIGRVRQSNGPSAPLPRMRVSKNCRFELAFSRPCTVTASISQ